MAGSDLHEPKGISSASANTVYVCSGSSTGTWQKLTASQLTGSGNPFGGQLLHIQEQTSTGVDGQSLTTGSNTRTLNTVVTNEISSATLATNVISLPAGTYFIQAFCPAVVAGILIHQASLYNNTASTTTLYGTSNKAGGVTSYGTAESVICGRFVLSGTSSLIIKSYVSQSCNTGLASSSGGTEIYSNLLIWKVA